MDINKLKSLYQLHEQYKKHDFKEGVCDCFMVDDYPKNENKFFLKIYPYLKDNDFIDYFLNINRINDKIISPFLNKINEENSEIISNYIRKINSNIPRYLKNNLYINFKKTYKINCLPLDVILILMQKDSFFSVKVFDNIHLLDEAKQKEIIKKYKFKGSKIPTEFFLSNDDILDIFYKRNMYSKFEKSILIDFKKIKDEDIPRVIKNIKTYILFFDEISIKIESYKKLIESGDDGLLIAAICNLNYLSVYLLKPANKIIKELKQKYPKICVDRIYIKDYKAKIIKNDIYPYI